VAEVSRPPDPAAGNSRVVTPRKLKWRYHVAAALLFASLRVMSRTWRLRLQDGAGVLCSLRGPVILCIWHNRLALSMWMWEHVGRPNIPCAGLVGLISASHDGDVLARTLRYFGVQTARGSSSRRGARALLELRSWAERGYTIAITPDGPRGPCYEIQDGIFALAQLSGLPILPVSTQVKWKFKLKSWDRFQIPLPFARCEVRIGNLLPVPHDINESERNRLKGELQMCMAALTED
jgi:lysophospholipid acyltransferase (LPLAT)-like uncharacterized protein